MRFPANVLNAVLTWAIAFSPFVLGSFGSYLRWEKRFEAVVNQGAARLRPL
jgi:ornithine lipid ester-linked acyl 2-hydroxylase